MPAWARVENFGNKNLKPSGVMKQRLFHVGARLLAFYKRYAYQ